MQFNRLRSELESFVASFEINNRDVSNEYSHQNCDQIWVNNWIGHKFNQDNNNSKINSRPKSLNNNISINQFSLELKSVINLLAVFSQKYNYLNENIDNFDEEKWNSIVSEINCEKEKLEQKLLSLKQKVASVEFKLNKIKRKRAAKLKRNVTHKKLNEEYIEKRNKMINEWFQAKHEVEDRIKRENDMKKEADIVLIEVRKKINDAKRYLKKVNALEKVRNALKSSAQQRSQFTSAESDSLFVNKISEMKILLKQRLETYYKEENALKSIIEDKYEKRLNEELSDKTDNVFNELNEKQLSIYESLFGSNQFPEPNNYESLTNWQYYEQSHHSIDNMIRIRHLWDKYLSSNEGSSIPKNYVWPISTSNPLWNKYIQK